MALALDPKEVSLYYDRANARRGGGDWRGAVADYDRAVMLDPRRAETYFARGWARLLAGVPGADLDAPGLSSTERVARPAVSPYMALLAVLGVRGAAEPAVQKRVLDEALANLAPRLWPVPVVRVLAATPPTDTALVAAAVSQRQRAEAHAFIGLAKLQAGDRGRGDFASAFRQGEWPGRFDRRRRRGQDAGANRGRGKVNNRERAVSSRPTGQGDFRLRGRRAGTLARLRSRQRADAGVTIALAASLAATRTPKSGSSGSFCMALKVSCPPIDLRISQARQRAPVSVGARQPSDERGLGDRPHLLESVFNLEAVFLDLRYDRLDGALVLDLGQCLDRFMADEPAMVTGASIKAGTASGDFQTASALITSET